jgi:hypothetical protein
MKALLHNTFQVAPGEVIQLVTTIDNPPFLAGYTTPPHGSKWASVKRTNTSDTRQFTSPTTSGQQVVLAVSCAEAIPTGAPYNTAVYTLTFSSITNPVDPPVKSGVVVPQGLGPISQTYTFIVQ